MATWRLLRCNPWSQGADPVPNQKIKEVEVENVTAEFNVSFC